MRGEGQMRLRRQRDRSGGHPEEPGALEVKGRGLLHALRGGLQAHLGHRGSVGHVADVHSHTSCQRSEQKSVSYKKKPTRIPVHTFVLPFQIFQLMHSQKQYFQNWENWVQLCIIVNVILIR